MGNSASSSGRAHHDDSVDYGSLAPQGVYTGPRDWNQAIVSQLIVARKLAPFYRPLEEYDESWDDDQILAARKELPDHDNSDTVTRIETTHTTASKSSHSKRPGLQKDPGRPEAAIYRGAVECPICFLYYPPNINHSRCCDQAICTECFVQIKRSEPTTTHVVSEPAACPYCVQENFGVIYTPPPWRSGLGSEGSPSWADSPRGSQQSVDVSASTPPTHKRRQKSFSADSPEVVTTDQIRPDWEAKLAAVRAAVARRANRRIIMRQVGDRLIPVGVTSGRVHALSPEEAANAEASEGGGSRRSRRRQQTPQGYEQYVGMSGQDLEELMVMEAMRLSLLEHEEQQRKEAEEKKKEAEAASAVAVGGQSETSGTSLELQAAAGPGPSTLEARSSPQTSTASPIPSSSSLSPDESSIPGGANTPGFNADSRSTSRARTPPSIANSNPSLLDDSSSVWRSRTPSPSPFRAATAALASASTAAAFLGTRSVEGSSTTSNDRDSAMSQDASAMPSIPVPSITLGDEVTTKPNGVTDPHSPGNNTSLVDTPGVQGRKDISIASLSNTNPNQTPITSDIDTGVVETRNKGLPSGDVPNQSSSETEL